VLRDILLPMVAALLISAPALADRHAADSGPAVLDTEPPALAITAPAGGELVYGNETHTLIWSLQEPHHMSGGHHAYVRANGDTLSATQFPSIDGQAFWSWTVPDSVSSASARLTVAARDSFGNLAVLDSETFTILMQDTAVDPVPMAVTALTGARPNPFNPATSVDFRLAAPGRALLTVHDLRGRNLRTLVDRDLDAGAWTARWDGRDQAGRPVPAAAYLLRLRHAGRDAGVVKVVLLP